MNNLIGTYECKVDVKGRLLLPIALKRQLGNQINEQLNEHATKQKELLIRQIRQKQKFVQDHLFESFVKKAYHPDRIERILNELEEEDPDRDNLEYMEECLL